MIISTNFKLNGRYEVERELGRGGFGVAYLARDTHLDSRPVVIKTPLAADDGTLDDPWFRRHFDDEILALARIKHPGVVGIYDAGWTPDGQPFFVMPYVEGESLRSAMRGGSMGLKRAAHIVGQLSFALSAAHVMGITHRDLKPENVMLQTFAGGEEFAFLIDFGIAMVKDLHAERSERITKVVGTLPYMAPEQLRGGPVPASDVWALGIVAYEVVTGRLPFPADNVLALDDMQRAGVGTMPRSLRAELPEAAQEVILRALSYDPDLRYTHAHEMGENFLRAILNGGGAPTLSQDYPAELRHQPAPPAPESPRELLRRCRKLFETFEEFRSPDKLLNFLIVHELSTCARCVKNTAELDFDQLLACLYRSGLDYRGQALLDLLAQLAARYRDDYRGQECEGLRGSLRQLLEQAPAAGS
ncbi:MAG TPA: serine/threonine-protein kinase [Pyrinomonadaceae bacterium]